MAAMAGCRDNDGPTAADRNDGEITPERIGPVDQRIGSIDDYFAALAEEIPGFGGFYFDAQGRMVVMLTGAGTRQRAVSVLTQRVGARQFSLPGGRRRADIANARIVTARHDFLQLRRWRQAALEGVSAVPGMTYLDISESANRLVIGARDATAEAGIRAALEQAGVPGTAAEVRRIPEFRFDQTLRDSVATMRGGVQIENSTGETCTHGPVARIQATSGAWTSGFLTNSHCTRYMGDSPFNGGTISNPSTFYQPTQASGRQIGTELFDAPFWAPPSNPYGFGGTCPSNRRCRHSDAALNVYSSGVASAQGEVARTAGPPDTVLISGSPFRMIDEHHWGFGAYEGELLTKVGRTTGLTQGLQSASTCADIPTNEQTLSGHYITLLCQSGYSAASGPGDSGAPVFFAGPTMMLYADEGLLAGMHVGSSGGFAVYSALYYIKSELGTTTYGTPTFTTVYP
ncbi:MAG TPA: hypothetical protein VEQ60_21610 [Longimicrobium sp.]|nr:hypothetical protein [Longimicrobium sp.]